MAGAIIINHDVVIIIIICYLNINRLIRLLLLIVIQHNIISYILYIIIIFITCFQFKTQHQAVPIEQLPTRYVYKYGPNTKRTTNTLHTAYTT
jgi:hypothetical protein